MKTLTFLLLTFTAAAQSFYVSIRKAHPLPHEYFNETLEEYRYYVFKQGNWELYQHYTVTERDTAQRIISTLTTREYYPFQAQFLAYDDSGRVVKYSLMEMNRSTRQWEGIRWLMSYTPEGRLLEQKIEETDSTGNWQELYTYLYYYTPDGRISGRLRTKGGRNVSKAACNYNANKKIQTIEYSQWNDSAQSWILSTRDVFRYNADGSYSRFNSEFFDNTTGTWHTNFLYLQYYNFHFNSQDRMTGYEIWEHRQLPYMDIYEFKNVYVKSWHEDSTGKVVMITEGGVDYYPYFFFTYFYFNDKGKLISEIHKKISSNGDTLFTLKSEYYYDGLDSLKRVITYYWNGKDSSWVPGNKYEYVYMNEKSYKEREIYLYPNPGQTTVFVAGLTPSEIFEAEIYSADGKLVKRISFYPKEGIPVEDLAKGIYFISIYSKDLLILTEKFIKSE